MAKYGIFKNIHSPRPKHLNLIFSKLFWSHLTLIRISKKTTFFNLINPTNLHHTPNHQAPSPGLFAILKPHMGFFNRPILSTPPLTAETVLVYLKKNPEFLRTLDPRLEFETLNGHEITTPNPVPISDKMNNSGLSHSTSYTLVP